jgi:hypothetical protein
MSWGVWAVVSKVYIKMPEDWGCLGKLWRLSEHDGTAFVLTKLALERILRLTNVHDSVLDHEHFLYQHCICVKKPYISHLKCSGGSTLEGCSASRNKHRFSGTTMSNKVLVIRVISFLISPLDALDVDGIHRGLAFPWWTNRTWNWPTCNGLSLLRCKQLRSHIRDVINKCLSETQKM